MRDYDDNNYNNKSRSRPPSRDDEGSEKGNELLGGLITLPENITPLANFFKNFIKPKIVAHGEEFVGGKLPQVLAKMKMGPETAAKVTHGVSTSLAYLVIFSDELAGSYRNFSRYISGRKHLAEDLSPVLKAEGAKDMISGLLGDSLKNNEVVQVARGRLKEKWGQDTVTDLSNLASSLPNLYIRYANKKQELAGKALTGKEGGKDTYWTKYNEEKQKASTHGIEEADFKANHWPRIQEEARFKVEKTKDEIEKTSNDLQQLWVPGGAAAAEFLRGHFVGKEKKAASKTTALDMICTLSDTVINDKEATGVNGVPFDAYIRKIFDTHQENMGQSKVGKRFDEKMEFACKEIAESITKGKMHPMALVHLVGDREIVKEKGKKIALREEVKSAIAAQVEKMPAKFAVDADEYLSESPVGEDKYKQKMAELQGSAKELFVATLPAEVAKKIGSTDEEIEAAQKKFKSGEKSKDLSRVVLDLNTLPDDKLKAAGQTEKEIALVRKLAPAAKEGRDEEILDAVSKKGQFKGALDTIVAGSMASGLISQPGELYERAGQKLFGEQEQLAEHKEEGLGQQADEVAEEKDEAFDQAMDEEIVEKPRPHVHHASHHGQHHSHHAAALE